ncbi:hypothetical protein [Rhizobium leguminosarum]|uniref:hypothetical protein n=1 Tax=Rhizobium leguminosarum TaxID=384 RepID=UPI0013E33CC8|nr:hypothetical protein [Rhizobium leguminosarum]UIJ82470.1 hypothetical protein LZK78_27405 [Rhizobium leguminosarum]
MRIARPVSSAIASTQEPEPVGFSGSMSLGCLAAMKNANPPDQCRKLITPNDDITMGACADKDLDRRKFVDVLPAYPISACKEMNSLFSVPGTQL